MSIPGCREEEYPVPDDQGGTVKCVINGVEYQNDVYDIFQQLFSGRPVDARVHSDSIVDFEFQFVEGKRLKFHLNLREDPRASSFVLPKTYVLMANDEGYFSYMEDLDPQISCVYGYEENESLTVTFTNLDLQKKTADGTFYANFDTPNPIRRGPGCRPVQMSGGEFHVSLQTFPN